MESGREKWAGVRPTDWELFQARRQGEETLQRRWLQGESEWGVQGEA